MVRAGGSRDRGAKSERILHEAAWLVTLTYYTISTLFVKVNISIVVSMR